MQVEMVLQRTPQVKSGLAVLGLLILLSVQVVRAEPNTTKKCSLPKIPLRITTWSFPPYVIVKNDSGTPTLSGVSHEFFWKLIDKCYKNCSQDAFHVTIVNSEEEMIRAFETNATDIGFSLPRPLKIELNERLSTKSGDLNFQPITVSQGFLFVIDAENSRRTFLENALTSLFDDTWPMIVFILLLGGIAGIVVWLLDHSGNKDEFPRTFIKGTYEGCWWAFVSMTTVGYGDKTPKSFFGRAFGVIWILLGLVVIAMFTATATNAITASSSMGNGLAGFHIGVLNGTEARFHAARYGAEVDASYSTFEPMSKALKNGQIDGILMDLFLASHYLNNELGSECNFKAQNMFSAKITYYIGWTRHVSLEKDEDGDHSCFQRKLLEMETDRLEEKYLKQIKAFRGATDLQGILNGHSSNTRTVLLILMGIFVGLMICGCIGEAFCRARYFNRKTHETDKLDELRMQSIHSEPFREMDQRLATMIDEMQFLRERINKLEEGLYSPARENHVVEADAVTHNDARALNRQRASEPSAV